MDRRPSDRRKLKTSTAPGAMRFGMILLGVSVALLIYAAVTREPKIEINDRRDPNRVVNRAVEQPSRPASNGLLFSGERDPVPPRGTDDTDSQPDSTTEEGGDWYAEAQDSEINDFMGLGEGRDALEAKLDAFGDVAFNKHTTSPATLVDGELQPALQPTLVLRDPLVVTDGTVPAVFGLPGIDTGPYYLYSQQSPATTADIALRLKVMNERYHELFADVCEETNVPGKVFIFTDSGAMTAAGGHPFMPGAFLYTNDAVGPRLLIRNSGVTDIPFWELLNHEGWHQFAALQISTGMPLWVDEGMAMYLGYGIFTGDGTVEGTLRPAAYYSLIESAPEFQKLDTFLDITNAEWHARANNGTVWPAYMQAWSLVHFMRRAEGGKYSDILDDYIADIAAGRDSNASRRKIVALESRYQRWLKSLTFSEEHTKYYQAITGILTSHLARAHAQGQGFRSGEAFVRAFRQGRLDLPKQGEADWLPPSLRTDGVWYMDQMEGAYGECDIEIVTTNGKPSIRLRHSRAGIDLQGTFRLEDGEVESVDVKWLKREPDNLERAYIDD
jgi:hypothetical protein